MYRFYVASFHTEEATDEFGARINLVRVGAAEEIGARAAA